MEDPMGTSKKQRPPDRMDSGDRRSAKRYLACFPVMFRPSSGAERLAVFRDVSISGGMLMTQGPLPVGDKIHLELYVSKDESRAMLTNAHVVRVQRRTMQNSYWHFDTAIEFETPLMDAEGEVKSLSEKQHRLGLYSTNK
jgi:hypothetical protein